MRRPVALLLPVGRLLVLLCFIFGLLLFFLVVHCTGLHATMSLKRVIAKQASERVPLFSCSENRLNVEHRRTPSVLIPLSSIFQNQRPPLIRGRVRVYVQMPVGATPSLRTYAVMCFEMYCLVCLPRAHVHAIKQLQEVGRLAHQKAVVRRWFQLRVELLENVRGSAVLALVHPDGCRSVHGDVPVRCSLTQLPVMIGGAFAKSGLVED